MELVEFLVKMQKKMTVSLVANHNISIVKYLFYLLKNQYRIVKKPTSRYILTYKVSSINCT